MNCKYFNLILFSCFFLELYKHIRSFLTGLLLLQPLSAKVQQWFSFFKNFAKSNQVFTDRSLECILFVSSSCNKVNFVLAREKFLSKVHKVSTFNHDQAGFDHFLKFVVGSRGFSYCKPEFRIYWLCNLGSEKVKFK